jgi:hypothetical protein
MADLPFIPNPIPLIIPATTESVYNESYIVGFTVQTLNVDATKQPLTVTFRPYNYATKQIYPGTDHDKTEFFDNIWDLVYAHPLAAQVIGGLVVVFSLEWQLRQVETMIHPIDSEIRINTERLDLVNASIDASVANGETPAEELVAEKTSIEAVLVALNEQLSPLSGQRTAILTALGVA